MKNGIGKCVICGNIKELMSPRLRKCVECFAQQLKDAIILPKDFTGNFKQKIEQ